MLDELWRLVNLRNDLQHFQQRLFVWDVPTFNERVVRESVLNAVSHRDYRSGGSIFVRQYPRRIEIVSPGGFPPGITPDNVLWQQNPRNRRIAEVLSKCGLVERAGQGFDLIFRECIRQSKPLPDFSRTDAHFVWLTLRGEIQDPEFLRFLEEIGHEKMADFSTEDFLVVDLVHREQTASQPPEGEIRISFGTGDNRASRAWSWNPAALIPKLLPVSGQGWRVYPEKRPRPGDEQGPADETYPGQSGFRLQDGRNAPGVACPFSKSNPGSATRVGQGRCCPCSRPHTSSILVPRAEKAGLQPSKLEVAIRGFCFIPNSNYSDKIKFVMVLALLQWNCNQRKIEQKRRNNRKEIVKPPLRIVNLVRVGNRQIIVRQFTIIVRPGMGE